MKARLPGFETLVDMARNDPEGLETLRRSLTDAVIAGASSESTRRRLQGLQFRVDLERRRAGTPLAAAIRISEMMCHSLASLHASLVTPDEITSGSHGSPSGKGTKSSTSGEEPADNVVPFRRAPREESG
jgi:hypothetical protein